MSQQSRTPGTEFVVCVKNRGYEAALELRKIYEALTDSNAAKHRQLRVVDESGEDYLYPEAFFASVQLPLAIGARF